MTHSTLFAAVLAKGVEYSLLFDFIKNLKSEDYEYLTTSVGLLLLLRLSSKTVKQSALELYKNQCPGKTPPWWLI